jgi:HSP20 family protein
MKHPVTRRESHRNQPLARTRDLFAGLKESLAGRRKGELLSENWPSLEISENDKEVQVRLEAPGLSEKDLDLNYVDGTLIIKGEKKEEREDRKRNVYYRESRYGAFTRSVPIGAGVDFSKAKAEFRNGVLKVEIPKTADSAQRRQIPIT